MFKSIMFKRILIVGLLISIPAITIASLYQSDLLGTKVNPAQKAFEKVGTPVNDKQLANWDISVFFDGENLPVGSGTLAEGEEIYQAQCAMCHGEFGEGAKGYPKMLGAPMDEFIQAAVNGEDNVSIRGINNLWAHAPTLYDYIRRAMPFFAPQSLTDEQAYSVTGYVLSLAEITDGDVEEIDAAFLKSIKMPSADNFYTDPRPDVRNVRCMQNCYDYAPDVKGSAVQGDISVGAVEKREKS